MRDATTTNPLFAPIDIGPMRVKNRIVMSSTETRTGEMCFDNGTGSGIHDGLVEECAERARGEVGLIILEDIDVDSRRGSIAGYETMSAAHPCLDRDLFIPAFKNLTDTVHGFGTKVVPNLRHLGRIAIPLDNKAPLTASPSPNPRVPSRYGHSFGPNARAATLKEIAQLQQTFAEAAFRAKRAGFDGVQIAGHHGFLISQFLSPATNRRTDRYGGTLENRMRFAVELVERVRARIGPTMAIIFALSGDELLPDGLQPGESKKVARELERAGADAIHVVPGIIFPFPNGHRSIPTMGEPHGLFVDIAREMKAEVSIPVIANGRLKDPALTADVVRQGGADMVSMTRALIADPEWAAKVLRDETEDIRPCIGCNYCVDALQAKLNARCTVNASWGREKVRGRKVGTKRVLVVGGGPAGMEAARVAALRGHTVQLIEKTAQLGGQLRIADVPPGKAEIRPFREYLIRQVQELPIAVQTDTEATIEMVRQLAPDVVIVASGAQPLAPPEQTGAAIPVVAAWSVLRGEAAIGQRVVIAGGGATGCEVAELLGSQGKSVTVLEMESELARDMNPLGEGMRYFMLERLDRLGVNIMLDTKFLGVEDDRVLGAGKDSASLSITADTVVVSTGVRPVAGLDSTELSRFVPEVRVVGDCAKPRTILDAVWEGSLVAEAI